MSLHHALQFKPLALALSLSCLPVGVAYSGTYIGNDLNSADGANERINALYSANRGSNGPGDQSLQFGDSVYGSETDDLLIGGLGIDVLFGYAGDDIIIGGTEDFNGFNRDRAFGGAGEDTFIWAPGDGNDFFDGGEGTDVLIMSLVGETKTADGQPSEIPVFGVSAPGNPGTGDFDGIFINESGNPEIDVLNGPGFCEIVEKDQQNEPLLNELGLDHLVRFILRGPRTAFNADPTLNDDGLRIAVHLNNVEFLVCGTEPSGEFEIFDLRETPALSVDISQLPQRAQTLVLDNLNRN